MGRGSVAVEFIFLTLTLFFLVSAPLAALRVGDLASFIVGGFAMGLCAILAVWLMCRLGVLECGEREE